MKKLNPTKKEELSRAFQVINAYLINPDTEEEQEITFELLIRSHETSMRAATKGVDWINKRVTFVTNIIIDNE